MSPRIITASLQTPYLLTIALTLTTALQYFPFFEPRPTFWLLKKLDLAFCSLLTGIDAVHGKTLPGLSQSGRRGRLSVTEKVRMRGSVARTRVQVVEVAGKEGRGGGRGNNAGAVEARADDRDLENGGLITADATEEEVDQDDNDDVMDDDDEEEEDYNATTTTDDGVGRGEDMRVEGNHGRWEMEIARVYERTIVELGKALDVGSPGSGGFG